jgi:hypothetical protein
MQEESAGGVLSNFIDIVKGGTDRVVVKLADIKKLAP